MPLNEAEVRKECQIVKEKGLTDVAVIGIFSPLDISGKQEVRVKQIILEEIPTADVVLSRDSKSSYLQILVLPSCSHFLNSLRSWSAWLPRKRKCQHSQYLYSQVCSEDYSRIQTGHKNIGSLVSVVPDTE